LRAADNGMMISNRRWLRVHPLEGRSRELPGTPSFYDGRGGAHALRIPRPGMGARVGFLHVLLPL